MSNVTKIAPLGRQQVIAEEMLEAVEQLVRDARDGKVVDLVVVANDADGGCSARWNMPRTAF